MTPRGIECSPGAGSGLLVSCAVKRTLSWEIAAPSSEGRLSATCSCSRESMRVSSQKSPLSGASMSPSASASRKTLASLSVKRVTPRSAPESSAIGEPCTVAACSPHRSGRCEERSVDIKIVFGHVPGGEATLECGAHLAPLEPCDPLDGLERFALRVDDETGTARLDDFGNRSAVPGDDRSSTCHGFDHDQSEGFRPAYREYQCQRVGEKLRLVLRADLTNELDQRIIEQRTDDALEINLVGSVHLGSDAQRNACGAREPDGTVGPFLRCNAPEKGEITAVGGVRVPVTPRSDPMGDGGKPVGLGQRIALMIGDGYQGIVRPAGVCGRQILQVGARVQRGHAAVCHVL